MRLLESSLPKKIYEYLKEGFNSRVYKEDDTVYWIGAGNEIGAIGTVIDFPTDDRMTIRWEDGTTNTYSITHPDIRHEDDYENWFNEDSEDEDIIYYDESAKTKTVKEYRIIDSKTKKVLKVFKAKDREKGYKEMREMGKKLKKDGKEDNLIYKEFTVKNNLKESFFVKRWNEATEDYQDYIECSTKEEAEKELANLKKNGEMGIIETFSEWSRDPELTAEVDWYNRVFNESAKPKKKTKKEKKPEERIIMQQGNVTCLKKDNKFKVFEDAETNLVEYDNQEEAMRDALNRCGVNPDNELVEEKDNLKESTQYRVIKTLNVGPSNYQSEVHGTYNSYEQAEDICSELNAQGIGATIKEIKDIDEALRTLLKKKEDLRSDDTITDDDYYDMIEEIDNIIINSYSAEEIEEAEKELGIE